MKRFLAMFELTVGEQRVVIVLLLTLVLFAALRTRWGATEPGGKESDPAAALDQSSPSPGTGP